MTFTIDEECFPWLAYERHSRYKVIQMEMELYRSVDESFLWRLWLVFALSGYISNKLVLPLTVFQVRMRHPTKWCSPPSQQICIYKPDQLYASLIFIRIEQHTYWHGYWTFTALTSSVVFPWSMVYPKSKRRDTYFWRHALLYTDNNPPIFHALLSERRLYFFAGNSISSVIYDTSWYLLETPLCFWYDRPNTSNWFHIFFLLNVWRVDNLLV